MQIDHDQIHKQLIEVFFREFMELFCPIEAEQIDFSQIEFLREEFFTDSKRGQRRRLDLLVKVRLKAGGEKVVLVHFEFESTHNDSDFPERNFGYFCQIYLRYRTNVISVALFTDDAVWKEPMPSFFESRMSPQSGVRFDFHLIKLKNLDYKQFLRSNNPLAFALMAKMSYDARQRVRLKADFLRLILGVERNDARRNMLLEYVDTYMTLDEPEQAEFNELVHAEAKYEEVLMQMTREERLEKRGELRGQLDGLRQSLKRILTKKFGPLPDSVLQSINEVDSTDRLNELTDIALSAVTLNELMLGE